MDFETVHYRIKMLGNNYGYRLISRHYIYIHNHPSFIVNLYKKVFIRIRDTFTACIYMRKKGIKALKQKGSKAVKSETVQP